LIASRNALSAAGQSQSSQNFINPSVLLSPAGTVLLKEDGPAPLTPASVSVADFRKLPESK
jgi:hypothetical protein